MNDGEPDGCTHTGRCRSRPRSPCPGAPDQLAVSWDDQYVTSEYLDAVSIEVPENDTAEFELAFPLSRTGTIESIRSPEDLRVLYNEETGGYSGGFPDSGELATAEDLAEVDVALSELWGGSFDG